MKSSEVKEKPEIKVKNNKENLTIGVLTSGGDAPGMNACVRAVVRTSIYNDCTIYGVVDGYQGLIEGKLAELSMTSVSGIINRGGTILRTGRSEEFKTIEGMETAKDKCDDFGINALVLIGGDGTFRGALEFTELSGIQVVGVPASIDNDVYGTDNSIGFDTAINTVISITDRLRDTADSHKRVFLVQVMGRDSGAIASAVGLACGAEAVIIPEVPYDLNIISESIEDGYQRGKNSFIIIIAEGALFKNDITIYDVLEKMQNNLKRELRVLVPGHIQRGGPPTAYDRILASRLGAFAIECLLEGNSGIMVGLESNKLVYYSINESVNKAKSYNDDYFRLASILGK